MDDGETPSANGHQQLEPVHFILMKINQERQVTNEKN